MAGSFARAGGIPAESIARWNGIAWSAVGSGLSGTVRALAVYDDGLGGGAQLYAGGNFIQAAGQPAIRLARWDGWNWSEVGGGVPGVNAWVDALLTHDDGSGSALFVAGSFGQVGVTAASNVARWDGLSWSTLGSGTNSVVRALAVYDAGRGPELYAGGEFNLAGGTAANRIARWNGVGWSPLGAGVSGTVLALGVHDDGSGAALIVGGEFQNAGGAPARGIASWRGSGWAPLGEGLEGMSYASASTVCSLDVGSFHPPLLVVGGGFFRAGTMGVSNLAAWDGADWAPLGAGLGLSEGQGYGPAGPHAFAVYDSGQGNGPELHLGGYYRAAGTTLTATLGMARWDGAGWHAFPAIPGMSDSPGALAVFDPGSGPGLYMGGNFGVAMWNGSAWDLGQHFALHGSWGGAHAMVVYDDGSGPALYVGGAFTDGCFTSKVNILRWDGVSCSAVGSGLGIVRALVEFDDGAGRALYAAGETLTIPPPGGYVARWDGVQWTQLGAGMDYQVYALEVFDDGSGPALYAGGRFLVADGAPAAGIARWNGATWIQVGGGITGAAPGLVRALAVHAEDGGTPALYAAGRFREMGGVPAASIARWDGSSWSALGLGIDVGGAPGAVTCLRSFDDGAGPRLWAGGTFSIAGGRPSLGVARWGEACGCGGTVYCSAQVNSAGCEPALRAVGDTSLTSTRPFLLVASPTLSSVSGLLFYGLSGAAAQPFAGGSLCVRPPLTRMAMQSSGGSPPPNDCSGVLSLDFKIHVLSGADPRLTAGTSVHAQYWYRDPASAGGSGTTEAVRFTLCP